MFSVNEVQVIQCVRAFRGPGFDTVAAHSSVPSILLSWCQRVWFDIRLTHEVSIYTRAWAREYRGEYPIIPCLLCITSDRCHGPLRW